MKTDRHSFSKEISALIAQMTLEEKLDQIDQDLMGIDWEKVPEPDRSYCRERLQRREGDARCYNILQKYAKEQTRLGIPFLISEEGLHGLFRPDCTIYPQQITMAASFEPALARRMGEGVAAEARAKGIHEIWAPVLDLARDPRWGRTEETCGEDPYLSAKMGAAVVQGLQGDSPDDLKTDRHVLSELKHYTGYGNPIGGLNCAPTTMGRHDVFSYCMPVFEAAVREAGAFNAMASYNSIDGQPVISDRNLLTEVLREEWGMPGFVRADMTAIIMQHTAHASADSPKEALKKAVKAGVDVQLADYSHEDYRRLMKELLEEGGIEMADIDLSVSRVLRCKFALGLFEQPFTNESLSGERARCAAHRQTALEIARKSAVLLKNEGNLLPLPKTLKKIALLGPNADKPVFGDYFIEPDEPAVTLADGIRALLPEAELLIDKGCNILGSEIRPVERWWVHPSPRPEAGIAPHDYGFTGEYFNGSDFSGEPVLTRLDPQINFNWIYLPPDDKVDSNGFCVRWTGTIRLGSTFEGRLGLSTPDSMRLWLNGELLVDGWEEKDANQMVPVCLKRGESYEVKIEFRNDARAPRVIFGCDSGLETIDRALELAKQAEIAIVALGDSAETSGENFDRITLDLPGKQLDFLKAVYATGTPVVLVLNTGRPVSCLWEQAHIPAILQAGFNGLMGGQAAAEILFGEVNPSGRLPISYPRHVGQIPCHYGRKPAGGKKYVEMDWNPLYPFGYGLSYTQFSYSDLHLSAAEIPADGEIEISFTVTNTGDRYGEEVAQLYLNDRFTSLVSPTLELKGFQRIGLDPGESRQLSFRLGFQELRFLNAAYEWVVEPGDFDVFAGRSALDLPLRSEFRVIAENSQG